MLRNLLAGVAALSMVATPALASPVSASPASKLSVAKNLPASARSGPAMKNGRKLAGGALIGIVVAVAVVAGVILIAESNDDSDSN